MELLLLDKDFQICGIVDDFSSLIWNRKYYECGDFSLQTSINNLEQFQNAKYLFSKNFEEVGIFETLDFKNTESTMNILRTGRFLESKLASRVINTTQYFKKMKTEEILRKLVNDFAISNGIRKIPKIKLGDYIGLGSIKTMQTTGVNLLTKLYELCKSDELSIRLRYDFDNDEIIFKVWQGIDRTDIQNDNSWAIFSRNFENILENEYSTDSTKYCNFAYIAGEVDEQTGTDENGMAITTKKRVVVTVDRVKDNEERRELYVDARDLQKDEDTTEEEYLEMLKSRGNDKLDECKKVEEVNFKIDPLSNLEYKKDFDLGDKAVYKSEELGLIIENRIVEVSEVYENGERTIDVTFGDNYNLKKLKELI